MIDSINNISKLNVIYNNKIFTIQNLDFKNQRITLSNGKVLNFNTKELSFLYNKIDNLFYKYDLNKIRTEIIRYGNNELAFTAEMIDGKLTNINLLSVGSKTSVLIPPELVKKNTYIIHTHAISVLPSQDDLDLAKILWDKCNSHLVIINNSLTDYVLVFKEENNYKNECV